MSRYSHETVHEMLDWAKKAAPESYQFAGKISEKSVTATYRWGEPRDVMDRDAGGAAFYGLLQQAPGLLIQLLTQLDELMTVALRVADELEPHTQYDLMANILDAVRPGWRTSDQAEV